jgi:hypothetical protein
VREDVIAFAHRDWSTIAALEQRRWAEQKSHVNAAEALSVGDELRHHASALRNDWPTEEDRRKDLASHIRISEMQVVARSLSFSGLWPLRPPGLSAGSSVLASARSSLQHVDDYGISVSTN